MPVCKEALFVHESVLFCGQGNPLRYHLGPSIYRPRSLAKQVDNALGSVCPSVRHLTAQSLIFQCICFYKYRPHSFSVRSSGRQCALSSTLNMKWDRKGHLLIHTYTYHQILFHRAILTFHLNGNFLLAFISLLSRAANFLQSLHVKFPF